jgi:ABC-type dipeptide/oligopeptide/nickel transport system ATPase component
MVVTKEEFLEWKEHPATKTLLKALRNDREYMKEMVVRGNTANVEEVKGRCNAIISILDLTYEDLVEGAREDAKY